jgi:hypothetical protein
MSGNKVELHYANSGELSCLLPSEQEGAKGFDGVRVGKTNEDQARARLSISRFLDLDARTPAVSLRKISVRIHHVFVSHVTLLVLEHRYGRMDLPPTY